MPDPARLISRSVAAAERECGSVIQARRKILTVTAACRYWLGSGDPADDWWLDELWLAACAEAQVSTSPVPSRQESDHGDRSAEASGPGESTGEKGA